MAASLSLLPLITANAMEMIAESDVATVVASAAVFAAENRLQHARDSADPQSLVAVVTELEANTELGVVTKAYLRYRALMAFAVMPESTAARNLLSGYLDYVPEVSVIRTDEGHSGAVIVFDAAAAARFSLGNWNQRTWIQKARTDLAAGKTDFLDTWLSAQNRAEGRLAASGMVAALQGADSDALASLSRPLLVRLARGQAVAPLARVVARRLADEDLAAAIISHADNANALAFLGEMDAFGEAAQLGLLELAASRYDLGSASMYQLSRIDSPQSRIRLTEHLASQRLGNSAAAALARQADPAIAQELAGIVRSHADPLARRRAVLALRLMPAGGGHLALRQLAADPNIGGELGRLIASSLP